MHWRTKYVRITIEPKGILERVGTDAGRSKGGSACFMNGTIKAKVVAKPLPADDDAPRRLGAGGLDDRGIV
jgi:hypothetical protein